VVAPGLIGFFDNRGPPVACREFIADSGKSHGAQRQLSGSISEFLDDLERLTFAGAHLSH
jgi:hypothetical protein